MTDAAIRRSYKDSLFRMIFREKPALLSLYNAVNGSDYQNPEDLEINTIEDVLYMGMKNDVSFIIDHHLNLYETQSTWNPNMPLRGLLYLGRVYQGYIEEYQLDIYSGTRLKLPTPQYIVFYNGSKNEPDIRKLRLSDSFVKKDGKEYAVECVATMININYGHNQKLMQNCRKLYEYAYLVAEIRRQLKTGLALGTAVDRAVAVCINAGILESFLRRHRMEVKAMILTEYNEELHLKTVKEEGYQEGMKKGIKEGMREGFRDGVKNGAEQKLIELVCKKLRKGKSAETIAEELDEAYETIKRIVDAAGKCAEEYDCEAVYRQLKEKEGTR